MTTQDHENLSKKIEFLELQISRLMFLEAGAPEQNVSQPYRYKRAALHMRLTSEEEIASRNLIASLHQLELGKWEEPQGLLPLNPTSLERISALRKSGKAPTMEDKVAVVAPALGGDESKAKAMILAWENPA